MSKEPQVESKLASLGESIDWPTPSPHLAQRVVARIESEMVEVRRRGWRRPAIALAAVLMVTIVMALSPSAREAVADLLGAAGIRIGFTADPTPAAGADLNLGEPLPINDLPGVVDFDVRIPGGEDPGPPDAVYVNDGGQVTMVWVGTPILPAAGESDIGLLLTQHKSNGGQEVAEKSVGPETGVQRLTVEGQPALWIDGAAHRFTLLDAEGNPIEETTRLAANVLLWDARGISHRLETTGDLQTTLTTVDKLEPVP